MYYILTPEKKEMNIIVLYRSIYSLHNFERKLLFHLQSCREHLLVGSHAGFYKMTCFMTLIAASNVSINIKCDKPLENWLM